jgi:hypothetical protein
VSISGLLQGIGWPKKRKNNLAQIFNYLAHPMNGNKMPNAIFGKWKCQGIGIK